MAQAQKLATRTKQRSHSTIFVLLNMLNMFTIVLYLSMFKLCDDLCKSALRFTVRYRNEIKWLLLYYFYYLMKELHLFPSCRMLYQKNCPT